MYYENCNQRCPYYLNSQLPTNRIFKPVKLENHNSKTLIVLQSPGVEEWTVGYPLQNTCKQGGTAGSRIHDSWDRTGHYRTEYDIVNCIRCFTGKEGKRDKSPLTQSIVECGYLLQQTIIDGNYTKIITFGKIAEEKVVEICKKNKITTNLIHLKHPNGGLSQNELDKAW